MRSPMRMIGGTEQNRVSHHDIIRMSVTQLLLNFGEFSPKRHLSLAFVCFHMYPDHSVRKFRIPLGITCGAFHRQTSEPRPPPAHRATTRRRPAPRPGTSV